MKLTKQEKIAIFRRAEGMRRFYDTGGNELHLSTNPQYDFDAGFAALPGDHDEARNNPVGWSVSFKLHLVPVGNDRYLAVLCGDDVIIPPFHWDPLLHGREQFLLVDH